MKDVFVRKRWDEENVVFYIHFQNDYAVRQIEISPAGERFLSIKNPLVEDSMLCDKEISSFDFNNNDFITNQEFETKWDKKNYDTLY